MQLKVQSALLVPDQLVIALQNLRVPQRRHHGADLPVLRLPDQNIRVAHGAQLRLRIDPLELGALQRHIVDAAFVKSFVNFIERIKLVLRNEQMDGGRRLQRLRRLRRQVDAGIRDAFAKHGQDLMLLPRLQRSVPVKVRRDGDGFARQCAFHQSDDPGLQLVHVSLPPYAFRFFSSS